MRSHTRVTRRRRGERRAIALLAGCASGSTPATDIDLGPGPAVAGEVKAGALEGVTLSFVSWGGGYQDVQMETVGMPFAEASGARVLSDGPTEYAKIEAQVKTGQVSWDVVDVDANWVAPNCGTTIMKLDFDLIDTSGLPEGTWNDCSVPANRFGDVFAFNAEKLGTAPTSWADFFDVEKFPGKRAIDQDVDTGVFEAALLADGVAPEDLYPLDVDRAVAKLEHDPRPHYLLVVRGAGAAAPRNRRSSNGHRLDEPCARCGRGRRPCRGRLEPGVRDLRIPRRSERERRTPQRRWRSSTSTSGSTTRTPRSRRPTDPGPVHVDSTPEFDGIAGDFQITNPEIVDKTVLINNDYSGENLDELTAAYQSWVQGS